MKLGCWQKNLSASLTHSLSSSYFSFLLSPLILPFPCLYLRIGSLLLAAHFDFGEFILFPYIVVRMASVLRQCLGTAGKVCIDLLPAEDEDSYSLHQHFW